MNVSKDIKTGLEQAIASERNKVLDGLRLCSGDGECADCPWKSNKLDCVERLMGTTIDLIEGLIAENERLNAVYGK